MASMLSSAPVSFKCTMRLEFGAQCVAKNYLVLHKETHKAKVIRQGKATSVCKKDVPPPVEAVEQASRRGQKVHLTFKLRQVFPVSSHQ